MPREPATQAGKDPYYLKKLGTPADEPCECCDRTADVQWEPSYTAYYWDGTGEDPNRPVALCRDCEPTHREYWKERWDDYYAGLL
jgi:hypothetical protein